MVLYSADLRHRHGRLPGADGGDVVSWRGVTYRACGWRHRNGEQERVYAATEPATTPSRRRRNRRRAGVARMLADETTRNTNGAAPAPERTPPPSHHPTLLGEVAQRIPEED